MKETRRRFLAILGLAPLAPLALKLAPCAPRATMQPDTIAEYVDYINFSNARVYAAALDPAIAQLAEELGHRAAMTMDTLTAKAWDGAST